MNLGAKKMGLGFLALLIIVMVVFFHFFVPDPFKVTDPNNPNFKAENFQFRDYSNLCLLEEALAEIFPVGTNKVYVDKILLRISGVRESDAQGGLGSYIVIYSYMPSLPIRLLIYPDGLAINVIYDTSNNIKDMLTPYGLPPGRSVYNFNETCN